MFITKMYQLFIWLLLYIQSFVYTFTYRIASRIHPFGQMKITNSIKNLLTLIQQYKEMKHTDDSVIQNNEKIPVSTNINLYMDHDPKQNAIVQYKKEKEKSKYDWIRNYYTNNVVYHKMAEIYEKIVKKS